MRRPQHGPQPSGALSREPCLPSHDTVEAYHVYHELRAPRPATAYLFPYSHIKKPSGRTIRSGRPVGYSQRRTRTHAFDWVVDQPSPNEYGEGRNAGRPSLRAPLRSLSLSPLAPRPQTCYNDECERPPTHSMLLSVPRWKSALDLCWKRPVTLALAHGARREDVRHCLGGLLARRIHRIVLLRIRAGPAMSRLLDRRC